ncbi:MAG TPA: glycosyltransferase family 4 protein [Clostridia bacterium]|nr:glycosyltransferase family 4 protein [Clostridia bacterium]
MRILLITQAFHPEMGALPSRMYPFAQELTRAGHSVFVATGMPNYPKGIAFEGYKNKLFMREEIDGYTVLRTASYYVPRNISRWRQLLSYLSFIPAAFVGGVRAGKVDVVFVTSPPIFPAIAAIALAKLRGAKLVFDIRDLWPDEIAACGGAKDGSLPIRFISRVERFIYRCSDCVCCTTPSFVSTVIERGVSSSKAVYLPNGADLQLFRPSQSGENHSRPEHLRGKFVVLFSGILGIKQGLDTLLSAAKLVEKEKDIVFLLVGGGSRERDVAERVQTLGLKNVILAGEQKFKDVPRMIQLADLCVSLLLPEPYLQKIISVKLFEYMASGKPIVGAHAGESARVIRESGCGMVVPPGNAEALAEGIRVMRDTPELCAECGERGLQWVEQHHSRRRIAQRLERILTGLVTQGVVVDETASDSARLAEAQAADAHHARAQDAAA